MILFIYLVPPTVTPLSSPLLLAGAPSSSSQPDRPEEHSANIRQPGPGSKTRVVRYLCFQKDKGVLEKFLVARFFGILSFPSAGVDQLNANFCMTTMRDHDDASLQDLY